MKCDYCDSPITVIMLIYYTLVFLALIRPIDVSAEYLLYFVSMMCNVWCQPAMDMVSVLMACVVVTHLGWEQIAVDSTAPCKLVLVMAIAPMVSRFAKACPSCSYNEM